MYIAKPTKQQLAWQDMELGVLIHYCLEIYRPDLKGTWYKTDMVREAIAPSTIDPKKLDPEQWVRAAHSMGAKYAVLVANHCTGFSLWDTKVNDFSIAHTKWRGGGGDICREFVEACAKYGMKPGFYYSTGCNGYYNINDELKWDYKSDYYREYVRNVEKQVAELWTEYGDLFEIWFDGGIIPPENGGPDLTPMLKKYQPDAICFQGPRDYPHDIRWVGNEDGLAPADCWATTNAGEARYDGTEPDEKAGVGDPDGKYYWPAECDMPNRTHKAFGGGWAWKAGEEHLIYTPQQLLDCYIRSVGRNANMLIGMAISVDGDFQDETQLNEFGALLRKTFGEPDFILTDPVSADGVFELRREAGKEAAYLVIREDISGGQRIREFSVSADGKEIYRSHCVGHKRIIPLDRLKAGNITFRVERSEGEYRLRDIAIFDKRD
ncbi:MAG: alpha-L-fucosidase [Clostridiales bacterium]|nr:alpha-L-fucosidase [Clostridiales bacterium]